jgi:hypothetical protein
MFTGGLDRAGKAASRSIFPFFRSHRGTGKRPGRFRSPGRALLLARLEAGRYHATVDGRSTTRASRRGREEGGGRVGAAAAARTSRAGAVRRGARSAQPCSRRGAAPAGIEHLRPSSSLHRPPPPLESTVVAPHPPGSSASAPPRRPPPEIGGRVHGGELEASPLPPCPGAAAMAAAAAMPGALHRRKPCPTPRRLALVGRGARIDGSRRLALVGRGARIDGSRRRPSELRLAGVEWPPPPRDPV